jgi:hypothetical protein
MDTYTLLTFYTVIPLNDSDMLRDITNSEVEVRGLPLLLRAEVFPPLINTPFSAVTVVLVPLILIQC